jgi:hypothetical protein
MNLFRRLIRWLARDEITAAHVKGYVDCAAIAELAKRVSYAEGEVAGGQRVLEQLQWVVAARTEGKGGIVTIEDLEITKRGMLH